MTNIHSIPSLTFTEHFESADDLKKYSLEALSQFKSQIELDLTNLGTKLTDLGFDMEMGLVDSQGFPLSGDVASARIIRKRIVQLRNDYKWVCDEIYKKFT